MKFLVLRKVFMVVLLAGALINAGCRQAANRSDSIEPEAEVAVDSTESGNERAVEPASFAATEGGEQESWSSRTDIEELAKQRDLLLQSMAYPTGQVGTSTVALKKATPREVRVGASMFYYLEVTNLTALPLENVAVKDQIAGEFEVKATSSHDVQRSHEGSILWMLGKLGSNERRPI